MPKTINDKDVDESLKWVESEFERARNMSDKVKARNIKYNARMCFDKRFPNPDTCFCCRQKITGVVNA